MYTCRKMDNLFETLTNLSKFIKSTSYGHISLQQFMDPTRLSRPLFCGFTNVEQKRCVVLKPRRSTCPPVETYEEKNLRLKRPLAPHVEIYQFELHTYMSIIHRATGALLYGFVLALAAGSLGAAVDQGLVLNIIDQIQSIPFLILGAKAIVAYPYAYHSLNGVRHLLWDAGRNYNFKAVLRTGKIVIALSVILTAVLMLL